MTSTLTEPAPRSTDTSTDTSTAANAGSTADRGRPVLAVLGAVAALAVVLLVVCALWWRADGGRWFMVETPSMGTAMPVGTLVLTEPVRLGDVEVGDVITFHAPESGTVYTHRVVDASPAGLTTQGDVNDMPDSGTLGQGNLIGKVVWHADGLGWALKAVPLVLVGLALTWALSLLVPAHRRRGVRLVGLSLSLAVANWLLHPWVGIQQMSQRVPEDGKPGLVFDVISTGLLPVRAEQVGGGASAVLRDGEVASMRLAPRADGAYDVTSALHLSWWGWALMVAFCLTPMLLSVLLGQPRRVEEPLLEPARPDTEDRAEIVPLFTLLRPAPGTAAERHLPTQAVDARRRSSSAARTPARPTPVATRVETSASSGPDRS